MQRLSHGLLALLLVSALAGAAHSQILPGQAVTYTNFDYVKAVASSISHVYFATNGGIIVYDQMAERWDDPLTGTDGLLGEIPTDLWVDKFDEKLYARTDFGLYQFDRLLQRWYPINELPPIDNDARRVSAPQVLLPQFDANYMGDGRFIDTQGRSFYTTAITADNSGHLWIGTSGFGPAVADDISGMMNLLPYGLLQTHVNTILADDSLLWLSGQIANDARTGLTAFNTEENNFSYVESGLHQGLPALDVNCLECDDRSVYVGTAEGIYVLDRGLWQVRRHIDTRDGLSDDVILSLKRFGDSLFVGTQNGLNMISLKTDTVYGIFPEQFAAASVYDIDKVDSTIWVASSAGAFRYLPSSDRLFQYKDPDLVLFSAVYNIEHYKNSLWLASDAGVVRLDLKSGTSTPYREPANPTSGRALAVNDKIVAIAADQGVTVIFLDRKKSFSRDFTVDDGLASNEVYSLLLDGDYLWIGTDEGLTRFLWNNPDRID